MRCFARCFLIIGGMLLLSGCSFNKVREGEIVDRRYEPGNWYWTTEQIYTGQTCRTDTSGYQTCTPNYTTVPVQRYDDPDWIITVRGCKRKEDEKPFTWNDCPKKEQDEREVDVDGKKAYKAAQEGYWYDFKKGEATAR